MSWRRTAMCVGATGVLGCLVVAVGLVAAATWTLAHPDVLCRGVERALGWPERSIVVADLNFDGAGRFEALGFALTPPEELRVQRPPPERPPVGGRPIVRVASEVLVRSGHFTAAPDPPFQAVEVVGVDGRIVDARWTPAARRIEGVGTARARRMELGAIELTDIHAPDLTLVGGDVLLGPAVGVRAHCRAMTQRAPSDAEFGPCTLSTLVSALLRRNHSC